jgi:beta-lactamase class A
MIQVKNARYAKLLLGVALLLALLGQPFTLRSAGPTAAFAATPVVPLYSSAPDEPDSQLQAIVEDVVADMPGTWGVAVKKLDTGQYAAYNGDVQQVSASLYKMWVLNELFHQAKQGILDLNYADTVTSDDAYYDAAQGDVRVSQGDSLYLWQAANLMITVSDNTSAHLLVRTLGPDNINRFMQANGLASSVLDWSGYGDNLTTPLDMLREMEMLSTSQMVDAAASKQQIGIMLNQQINNMLPVGLPDGTPFAHKTGNLDSLLHDAGIIYSPAGPYVIVAMTSNLASYSHAYSAVPELSRRVYEYFNSRSTSPAMYFPETRQSVGHDFLKFWNSNGGLRTFGFPVGPEQMKGDLLVQQFERARFELHLDGSAPGTYPQVGLGLVGAERAAQLNLSWPSNPNPGKGKYFQQTGQVLTGAFLDYWLNNGGERLFGYPISPAQEMVSPSDGQTYMTQWFQRARMEVHPELPAGHRVVLGTLGTELASSR